MRFRDLVFRVVSGRVGFRGVSTCSIGCLYRLFRFKTFYIRVIFGVTRCCKGSDLVIPGVMMDFLVFFMLCSVVRAVLGQHFLRSTCEGVKRVLVGHFLRRLSIYW